MSSTGTSRNRVCNARHKSNRSDSDRSRATSLYSNPVVCCSLSLTTIVAKYAAHADVVATNVISVLSNTAPAKEYKGSPELIILTNGKVRLDPF